LVCNCAPQGERTFPMCLSNIRPPTEEEKSKVHIGYKIVKRTEDPNVFLPFYNIGILYRVGASVPAGNRESVLISKTEEAKCTIQEGIHFHTDEEILSMSPDLYKNEALIKISVQGEDIVAFGIGPCRRPCRCPCPNRCQAVATKITVLEEIK